MRFSFSIFLGFFLLTGFAAYLFFSTLMTELKPGFRQSTEESLVDVANLLAELAKEEFLEGDIADGRFAASVKAFRERKLNAAIWSLEKRHPGLSVYITDADGIVVYDSAGENLGRDFSQWNDVYLTLRGGYGARSTLAEPGNKFSSVMHVAAPILAGGEIVGALTVMKSNTDVRPFLLAAQRNLTRKGGLLMLVSLLAGLALSYWLSLSVRRLAAYANTVKRGRPARPPKVYGKELNELSSAMTEMKAELEGRQYIEHYVHSLTHQLKTPITAIRGAAELIDEDMAPSRRSHFVENIKAESLRLAQQVERLLSLAEMENREALSSVERFDLKPLLEEVVRSHTVSIQGKRLAVDIHVTEGLAIDGDRFLLQQAVSNLLDNAVGFSPEGGIVSIDAHTNSGFVTLDITDQGPGIPGYATELLFDRFYSLPRPGNPSKGTGLGLCFVKEIARLHEGDITLANIAPHGVKASLRIKLS